jgi:hypothetical protein
MLNLLVPSGQYHRLYDNIQSHRSKKREVHAPSRSRASWPLLTCHHSLVGQRPADLEKQDKEEKSAFSLGYLRLGCNKMFNGAYTSKARRLLFLQATRFSRKNCWSTPKKDHASRNLLTGGAKRKLRM